MKSLMSEIKMDLFNIRSGNVCSLCEKQLDWSAFALEEKQPIALTPKRRDFDEFKKRLLGDKTHE